MDLLGNRYPERLGLAVIVNAPFYFTVFFSVRTTVQARTLCDIVRIQILHTNIHDVLVALSCRPGYQAFHPCRDPREDRLRQIERAEGTPTLLS